MKIKLFVVLLLSITTLNSQQKNVILISETIQNYYDGYIERDLSKLEKAFDLKYGTMKVPVFKNEKLIGFRNRYFKEVVPKWGNRKKLSKEILKNCLLTIQNINVVDDKIAIAKISMKVDTITYIDLLSLHKINNIWKITNKMYTVRK